MKITRRLQSWWHSLRMDALLDPEDNSVTLSKGLFEHLRLEAPEEGDATVFVFRVGDSYGFMANHGLTAEVAQLCHIQRNDKHQSIGFETLRPSVGRIFYDYGLPSDRAVRLSVTLKRVKGKAVYVFDRPTERLLQAHKKQ